MTPHIRKRHLKTSLDQFIYALQAIGISAVSTGNKMLLTRVTYMIQIARDLEAQLDELDKEIHNGI